MSDRLIITPDKVLYRVWNSKVKQEETKEVDPEELFGCLWDTVEFQGIITLRRIFELIDVDPELWESVIQENILPLLEEMKKPTKQEEVEGGMECLQIYWGADLHISGGEQEFSLWPSFHGYGKYTRTEDDSSPIQDGEETGYAIEFTPVNELADYPVELLTAVKVVKQDYDNIKAPAETIDLGHKPFTLLEVVKAIFWELTFAGTPDQRNEQREEIHKLYEEVQSGEAKTFSWEELQERLEKGPEEKEDDKKELKDPLNLLGGEISD
jgi:hypothetical protein